MRYTSGGKEINSNNTKRGENMGGDTMSFFESQTEEASLYSSHTLLLPLLLSRCWWPLFYR